MEKLYVIPAWNSKYPDVNNWDVSTDTFNYFPNDDHMRFYLDAGDGEPFRTYGMSGWGYTPPTYVEGRTPNQDGFIIQHYKLAEKEISFNVLKSNADRKIYIEYRRALLDFMSSFIPLGHNGYRSDSLGALLGYAKSHNKLPQLVWEDVVFDLPEYVVTWGNNFDNRHTSTNRYLLPPFCETTALFDHSLAPDNIPFYPTDYSFAVEFMLSDGLVYQPASTEDEWGEWIIDEPVLLTVPSGLVTTKDYKRFTYNNISSNDITVSIPYFGNYYADTIITIRNVGGVSLVPTGPVAPENGIRLRVNSEPPFDPNPQSSAFQINYVPPPGEFILADLTPGVKKAWLVDNILGLNSTTYQDITEYLVFDSATNSANLKMPPANRRPDSGVGPLPLNYMNTVQMVNAATLRVDIWFKETFFGV